MSACSMTPIREEEADSVMSAKICTPALEKEAEVGANKAANMTTTPDDKEEEINTSSSASTIVPLGEEEMNGGMIVIGYFFQVPSVKWHPQLEMMSKSGLSQGQYERKVLAQGFRLSEEIDEFISIDCPDMPMGVSRTFHVPRSALMRSPVLATFFASLDYLPGCKMNLHFMNDPGICFEIVQTYLENGPDCYPLLRLKIYISRIAKDADRFRVLIRLHKLAIKLDLVRLKNMAFEVINDMEWEMSAECCPKIAQLVFAHQSPYDNTLKLWVLKHIGHFYKKLSRSNTWAALVPTLDPELGQHWATMSACEVRVLSMIAEEATDEAVSDALADFPSPARNSAVSAVKGPSTSSSPAKSEASTQTDDSSLTEVPNKVESSNLSPKPQLEKTNEVATKAKKHKRSRAMTNHNQIIVGMHKEWLITCTPTKRSKISPPTSAKSASPPKPKTKPEETNTDISSQKQPTITVSQYDQKPTAAGPDPESIDESFHEILFQQQQQQEDPDDAEWEDEEEEAAIQEAIRSFGATPRDDSKAREVLGLPERSASIDGPPRPRDENAKARRVLGINDDGGGFIAGRKETRMMRVKKGLVRFNYLLNA